MVEARPALTRTETAPRPRGPCSPRRRLRQTARYAFTQCSESSTSTSADRLNHFPDNPPNLGRRRAHRTTQFAPPFLRNFPHQRRFGAGRNVDECCPAQWPALVNRRNAALKGDG